MRVIRLIHSKRGGMIISAIFGIAIVCVLFVCDDKTCNITYVGPSKDDITKIFRKNNKCVKYTPVPVSCDKMKKSIPFA